MNTSRITEIKAQLKKKRITSFFITDLINIRYLSGFTGSSAFMLLSNKGDYFFTDGRYSEQSKREICNFEVVITKKEQISFLTNFIKKLKIKKMAIEDTIIYRNYSQLERFFSLTPVKDVVEKIRMIKESSELERIEKAVKKAEKAFLNIKGYIKKGATERSIALKLEEEMRRIGVGKLPFDIIVASGKNSALPHAMPSEKKLESGDLVIIDWGGEDEGYFSDMTRTFLIKGGDRARQQEIYHTVRKANMETCKQIKRGVLAHEVDSIARDIIKSEGYGEYFTHSTGHGIGLDVHEQPYISAANRKALIETNMVFTIEPGVYIPDFGGVRIEDMVVVKENGASVLTSLPRELAIV